MKCSFALNACCLFELAKGISKITGGQRRVAVLFFSGYMIALPKYNDEIYLEIAKMNVFEDKGLYYKQIFLKKIPFSVYQKWNSVFEDLRECSEKLHKELFEELRS